MLNITFEHFHLDQSKLQDKITVYNLIVMTWAHYGRNLMSQFLKMASLVLLMSVLGSLVLKLYAQESRGMKISVIWAREQKLISSMNRENYLMMTRELHTR